MFQLILSYDSDTDEMRTSCACVMVEHDDNPGMWDWLGPEDQLKVTKTSKFYTGRDKNIVGKTVAD